jgi:hypothetical protein
MKAFVRLAVTAGLIVAIPVANAQTRTPHDAGKSPHHAASHSKGSDIGMPLQTVLRHLLRPSVSIPHVARRGAPSPPSKPTEVATGPTEAAAVSQTKTADAASGPPSENTGAAANLLAPQILPTRGMPVVQGLE